MTTKDMDLDCYWANLESSDFWKPWTPTKEELEELEEMGFKINRYWSYYLELHSILNAYLIYEKSWFALINKYATNLYPTSRQDLETLIRLFTPHKK